MNSLLCPICERVKIEYISESGIAGGCASCRDEIIPKHIPLEQHLKYVEQYLKEKK